MWLCYKRAHAQCKARGTLHHFDVPRALWCKTYRRDKMQACCMPGLLLKDGHMRSGESHTSSQCTTVRPRNDGFKNVDVPPPPVQSGVNCFHIGMPHARLPIILPCKSVRVLVHRFPPRLKELGLHEDLPHLQTVIMQLPPAPERSILPL